MFRRLLGWGFRAAAVVSLVLSVAVVFAWVWSYCYCDLFRYSRDPSTVYFVESDSGGVTASMCTFPADPSAWTVPPSGWFIGFGGGEASGPWWWLGFGGKWSPGPGMALYAVRVPYWFILALALVVPGARIWQARRVRGRRTAGLCLSCGYDLRASKERCPECGAAIPK